VKVEDEVHRRVDAGEVPAGGVDDALRFSGRAGGVEGVEEVLGIDPLRLALRVGLLHQLVVPVVAPRLHVDRLVGLGGRRLAHHHHHRLDRGSRLDRLVGHPLERDAVAAPEQGGLGDEDLRLRVVDAVAQGFGGEPREDDRMNRADPRARQHGDRGFGHEWEVDRDAIALGHSERLESVREPRDVRVQLAIRDPARVARLAFPDDRGLFAATLEVTVETVVRGVERAADEPLRVRRIPLQHAVPGAVPVQPFGPPGPERFGVGGRLVPDRRVVRVRGLSEGVGGGEASLLVEQRVDRRLVAVGHRRSSRVPRV
jgi:hypothetical protein